MLDFAKARRFMVNSQLRTFDVNDIPLLAAAEEIPRERFVPGGRETLAYIDQNLPVAEADGERRHMLAPMVLARMIQNLGLEPGHRVLDVACGTGYAAALMARLGASVTLLDVSDAIVSDAVARLAPLGIAPEAAVVGPLERGAPDHAPFDAILINGTVETEPRALLEQLGEGGRLVCVTSAKVVGRATLYVRAGASFGSRSLFDAHAPVLRAFKATPGFVF